MEEKAFVSLYKDIFIRLIRLVLNPKSEWKVIADEKITHETFLTNYLLPVIGLFSISLFIIKAISAESLPINIGLKHSASFFVGFFGAYYLIFQTAKYLFRQLDNAEFYAFLLAGYPILFASFFGFAASVHPSFRPLIAFTILAVTIQFAGCFIMLPISNKKKLLYCSVLSLLLLTLPSALYLMLAKFSSI